MEQISGIIEIHFTQPNENGRKILSINSLVDLNAMLFSIQKLLPEYNFEIIEVKKGSIVETIIGDLAGVFLLATILYRASKAILELKKSNREIKKIEAETRKIEEETKKICTENCATESSDRKVQTQDEGNSFINSKNELHELVQILREFSIDYQEYVEYANDSNVLKEAKELHRCYHIERIILTYGDALTEKRFEKSRFEKSPCSLSGSS
ncbi:MAG: hypothetical protein D3914_10555 [Candidatus Electrothrix sp. LOE2]|nr:hypothetical protein [Candidatus Electrothrix sp. LOE2]